MLLSERIKRLRERKGFTLIELMIVIAIIAILAAIAIPQYNAYREKAKAKDLISIARNCAQEIAAQCVVSDLVNVTQLASCSAYNGTQEVEPYLWDVSVNVTSTTYNCTSGNLTVKAGAEVGKDDGTRYYAQCTVTGATDGPNVKCEGVFK